MLKVVFACNILHPQGVENSDDRSYRDVVFLGDCDDGIRELSR